MAAAPPPGFPAALHPPFVPRRLYRIYDVSFPGRDYLAIYEEPRSHQSYYFKSFNDFMIRSIRVGQPGYGMIGKFVGPLRPDEEMVRGELEALYAEGEAIDDELEAAREEEGDAHNRVADEEAGAAEALLEAQARIRVAQASAGTILRRLADITAAGRNAVVAARRNAAAAAATQAALAAEQNNNAARAAVAERNATARSAASAPSARIHPCSFPGCTNTAPYMCAKCSSSFYCSKEHQQADWKRHKPVCYALSAKAGGRRRKSRRSTRKSKRRY